MKLTVLMDNNTYIDKYYLGEPAVSYYIGDGDRKILFDMGYSGAFIENAKAMGIKLESITDIVISHGHNDHTGGLKYILDIDFENRPIFTAHPDAFLKRSFDGLDIGTPVGVTEIGEKVDMRLTKSPVKISENITFLGEIPQLYEKRYSIGVVDRNGIKEQDFMLDDSALVYENKEGIYIITGCSHSGICNIISQAKNVTGKEKVLGLIGGLHLFEKDWKTKETINFLNKENIEHFYPCHCTSFKVRSAMDKIIDVKEVGVGLNLEW